MNMDELNAQPPTPNSLHFTPNTQPRSPKPRILIVDDDEIIRTQLRWLLATDYEVFLAGDRESALEVVGRERPGVVMLDLGLEPHPQGAEEGIRALSELSQQDTLIKVIIITGRTEKEYALKAIASGAYDYLCKPIQTDELKVILKRAVHVYRLEQENRELQHGSKDDLFEGMLALSPQMQAVFELIRKVATTDASVLITGESGTGKELTARAIHRQSLRRDGPFDQGRGGRGCGARRYRRNRNGNRGVADGPGGGRRDAARGDRLDEGDGGLGGAGGGGSRG